MKVQDNDLIFESTGRKEYVFSGVIGLSAECLDEYPVGISYGGDGSFGAFNDELSIDEQNELADYMIGIWTRYKEKAKL